MHPTLRASASSGWLPASLLAVVATAVVAYYGTPISQVAIFGVYVVFGMALPGMLVVRLLRGRATHISEDLTLGLAAGYCLEIATYIPARAVGAPLLFVLWPVATLIAFVAVPRLRRHWHGSGERAPAWWSWSLAAMLGYLLIYAAGTFFTQHHLAGTDTPSVDMPYHLALIAELRYHVPPDIPYVTGVPLAYHWFFYADAAATSWVTGIEPVTLLYRLSGLPMFATFAVLTASAARRLISGWWAGPIAVAIAFFGAVAGPYGWIPDSVPDTQTLSTTWASPTNLFGLALFAATILIFLDLLKADSRIPRSYWLLVGLMIFGVAGAKATQLPLLILGLFTVLVGTAIGRRCLHSNAAVSLVLAITGLVLATILLFRGASLGLMIGPGAAQTFAITSSVGARNIGGLSQLWVPMLGLVVAAVLWSFLWAGAYGLLIRWRTSAVDSSILVLVGICLGAFGAVSIFLYPSLSQNYYLRGAAGAFGLLTVAGIAAVIPESGRRRPLIAAASIAVLVGTGLVLAIEALGRTHAPKLGTTRLAGVFLAMVVPIVALLAVAIAGYVVARMAERRFAMLRGAVPLLVVALVMGFSAPRVAAIVITPFIAGPHLDDVVPGDGITAARWLRDHSDPADLVATDLHCRPLAKTQPGVCDARNFWVAGYTERHVLVEGWAYTTAAQDEATRRGLPLTSVIPFWDPALLAANDRAFTDPSVASLAALRDGYGVRWLFADVTHIDADALGRQAALRFRVGDFVVYEVL